MAQARLWLWGLVPLVAFWLLCARLETRRVETDLARAAAVAASGSSAPSTIAVRGRDIFVGGPITDRADRASLVQSLARIPGVRRVVSRARLVPEAKPHAWSATKDGRTLALAGDIPSPQAVVDDLAGAGLDRGDLDAIGYGASKPVAPNDTPDGMAKNRRIELVVK